MKKLIPLILCLVLLVCLPGTSAAAETDLTQYAIANGDFCTGFAGSGSLA